MTTHGKAACAFAAILAVAGCIENPGPDSRLDRDGEPYEIRAVAVFRNTQALHFHVREDSGEVLLRVTNQSWSRIDSAGYTLQLCPHASFTGFGRPDLCTESELDWTGRFGRIDPGQGLELGPIHFSPGFRLRDITPLASVLRVSEAGTSYTHALNGVYRGAFSATDTSGTTSTGLAKGIIDSDGSFSFLLDSHSGLGEKGMLTGDLDTDGSVKGEAAIHDFNLLLSPVMLPAAFVPEGRSLSALFVSTGPGIPQDTLELALEKFMPF